ncbi:MAG: DNA-methyltransferase, partial [Polyangiales bacterium]
MNETAARDLAPTEVAGTINGATFTLVQADCLEWMERRQAGSIHAIVTDPPFSVLDFSAREQEKLRARSGGTWRQPSALGGSLRMPVPRFTELSDAHLAQLREFFARFAERALRVLVPGGHACVAANPLLSDIVFGAFRAAGFQRRGEVIRLVQTLRGGDRPKGAETEFPGVSVMPRSSYEPWGLFRNPCMGTVPENLRIHGTGGLRRVSADQPFSDVIRSAPTRSTERSMSPHPSLKPQAFMRQLVRAALPLGRGVVLDPFSGGGSTIAAAIAVGYQSIGI